LSQENIYIGRDKLIELLREHKLLIKPIRKYTMTTNSKHMFKKYPNIIKDLEVKRANQVYVSDITYIPTLEGFMYLFLITDMYSRKIVGYDISESLNSEGAIKAIKRALRKVKETKEIIHHSDRGIQYCCHEYVKHLKKNDLRISMTEENHVYENALAEQVNGILKTEFIGLDPINNKKIVPKLIRESIEIYNNERLHMSLDYKTPNQVHCQFN
jgi:putative transposase